MNIQFADRFKDITGSEIRKIFALLSDPEMISLAGGNPSPDSFPVDEIKDIIGNMDETDGRIIFQYGNTFGMDSFLDVLKKNSPELKDYDDVITLTGSSQGIDFAARTLLNPGDAIIVESPTFLGAIQTFKLAEADIHTVDVESDGVDLNCLEDEIKKCHPKFFYIIPTFQNPSGKTTSQSKRKAIYELCKKYNVLILEDDPYKDLRYDGTPLESIKAYDEEGLVIKLMSFSKIISPGMRVGYAIAHKDIIQKFNLCKQGADVHTSNVTQYIALKYFLKGYLAPHIKNICDRYRVQRDCMMNAIINEFPMEVHVQKPMGGLFAWAEMPENMDGRDIFMKCVERKVAFVPGEPFYAKNAKKNTFRLNFSMSSNDQIEKGIHIIGQVLRENL